jgi:23S rRNA (uracil1939-C5)-methyltransferase
MRRRRRKNLPTTPITLEIEKLSHEGRGIAHHEGKVVFVAEALPGEIVDAVLTSRRESYDEASLSAIKTSSPDRITPACEFSSICGGCSLQHFDPQAQLQFKQDMLFEKLSHAVPDKEFEHLSPLTGPVLGYRRKARLAVRYVHKKEQVLVGFREKNSSFITNMDSCQVLDPRIGQLLPALSALISGLQGFREIPQIEVAAGDPDMEGFTSAFIFRHLQPLSDDDMEKLQNFAKQHAIALYLQSGGMETVCKSYPEQGEDRLYYRLPDFDLTMAFHPTDFTQVNAEINRKMIARAVSLLELTKEDVLLDLFCGLGNFTLPLARHCGHITGVEGAQTMVDRAYANAQANGIENVDFYSGDLTQPMKGAPWMKSGFSKIVLDPPRSGAFEVLPEIIAIRPERIVYISCNPATLARDAAYLVEYGYSLSDAGVMDMFPQTAHVEAMALFIDQKKAD